MAATPHPLQAELDRLVAGRHRDPHHLLGAHPEGRAVTIRAYRPEATAVTALVGDDRVELSKVHPGGVFEGRVARRDIPAYRLEVAYGADRFILDDPYRFPPTLGDLDLHLFGEGRHERVFRKLGAHPMALDGVRGTAFAVWAPSAAGVRVVGDFNSWDGRLHQMRGLGSSGVWEVFVPGIGNGTVYKFELATAAGARLLKADPYAFACEAPPGTASIVWESVHQWGDGRWMAERDRRDRLHGPISVYEAHLGSWRQGLSFRGLAEELPDYVAEMGFTHVEFLPVAAHPYTGSWGYQVSGYFATAAQWGSPDDFRHLVDRLHQRGVGVIVDWVPGHFPRDEWALARFDGTHLYEHADPRQGEHPDWGTLVFNFGRNEVRNFLVANALYWIEEFHLDGLRVDAVASMLYLDYSREEGQWVPNRFGGNENLEAIEFLRQANAAVYGNHPGAMTIAEESTAWPSVSRPVYLGGLGFGFKWNMGWMHDTLDYFAKEPIYRRFHHNLLTFALMYAYTENFVLPLSHDEVVHGKRSLLAKMPGDEWQRFANLRAMLALMWAHPGKKLLFMGAEVAQESEWSHDASVDWEGLRNPRRRGVQQLVVDLNRLYAGTAALWERDAEPEGFHWIDANDADSNTLSFLRWSADGRPLACLANLSPVPRYEFRVGLPSAGTWREVLNTDAEVYGGSGVGNLGAVQATPTGWHAQPASAQVTLPPLGTVWLEPEAPARAGALSGAGSKRQRRPR